jgi:WD40 repeat protein
VRSFSIKLLSISILLLIVSLGIWAYFLFNFHDPPVIIDYSVAWKPNNGVLAVGGNDLRLYSESLEVATVLEKSSHISQLAWSPDGAYLVTVGEGIKVWEVKTNKLITSIMSDTYFTSVAWSRDGNKIAVGGSRPALERIFNGKTFSLMANLASHRDQVSTVAWSPDSSKLATGSIDGTVIIWAATTGEKIHTFQLPKDVAVTSVAWSPSGKKLAVGSLDQTLRFLDTNTWQLDKQLVVTDDPFWVSSIAWRPDETQIATTDEHDIKIWDTASARLLRTLQVQDGFINSVCWSSDGTKIATAGSDNTVRVWNAVTGEVIASRSLD